MAVQPGLCGTRSETPKTGFLRTRLINFRYIYELFTETAMGKSVNAQGNENSEYVQAVYR